MRDQASYTVSLTTLLGPEARAAIEAGELLERRFDTSDELWSFVPDWVLATLLIALVPEASEEDPDPTTRVTTIWEGPADVGTAWMIDSADLDGLKPGHFVRLERRFKETDPI